MPSESHGEDDQTVVLRELSRDLYKGGVPLWALEPCLQRVTEGMTGEKTVEWLFLPRKAAVYCSDRTRMFGMVRGYDVSLLETAERVATRCASYASNAQTMSTIPASFPNPKELNSLAPLGSFAASLSMMRNESVDVDNLESAEELSCLILDLASKSNGLVYFINSKGYEEQANDEAVDHFWIISEEERELFSRLASADAKTKIREMNKTKKVLYKPWVLLLCRMISGAGAAAIWFHGSWIDIVVAACLALVIALIAQNQILSKQEKIVFEVVASAVVGMSSGLVVSAWPQRTCFNAMALSAVIDILQGFRIVFAVIEVMSKHTVAGSADLIEGLIFTGLIAMSLRVGQQAAFKMYHNHAAANEGEATGHGNCDQGINHMWYIVFVPASSIAWATLFNPKYKDLPAMAFHGALGFVVNYGLTETDATPNLTLFVSASVLSFSAGIISRFTGRQSIGNTVCGIYVLVPGAYLTQRFFEGSDPTAFTEVAVRGILIGLGTWTGSIFCSPTVLGSTRTLLFQSQQLLQRTSSLDSSAMEHSDHHQHNETPFTMLSF
jgi:uncharacterized membrane protein YjjP (DUF1212 family)